MKHIFLIYLLAMPIFADELQLRYGIGIALPEPTYNGEVLYFSAAHQSPFMGMFQKKTEVGLWSDSGIDRKSSGYAAQSFGLRVIAGSVYIESLWGIAFITSPDKVLLTGNFQFTQDLGIGLRDGLGRGIGLNYKHFSNAGIERPNAGRDSIQVQLNIPLTFEE